MRGSRLVDDVFILFKCVCVCVFVLFMRIVGIRHRTVISPVYSKVYCFKESLQKIEQ